MLHSGYDIPKLIKNPADSDQVYYCWKLFKGSPPLAQVDFTPLARSKPKSKGRYMFCTSLLKHRSRS